MKITLFRMGLFLSLAVSMLSFAGTAHTVLLNAVRTGNLRAVSSILEELSPEDDCNEYEESALMAAAYHGRADISELLISNGASVNRKKSYTFQRYRNDEVYYIESDPSQSVEENFCSGKTSLAVALLRGNSEVVRSLLRANADVTREITCMCQNFATSYRYGFYSSDRRHYHSPLEISALQSDVELVTLILDTQKELNREQFGKALLAAVSGNNTEALQALLSRLADVQEAMYSNDPVWPDCYKKYMPIDDYSYLRKNHTAFMRQVYDACLFIAVEKRNKEYVSILLNAGLEYSGKTYFRALEDAISYGDRDIMQLILSMPFEREAGLLRSSLVSAVGSGHLDLVKCILDRGAEISEQALCKALEMGNYEILKYLLEEACKNEALMGSGAMERVLTVLCLFNSQLFDCTMDTLKSLFELHGRDASVLKEAKHGLIKLLISRGVTLNRPMSAVVQRYSDKNGLPYTYMMPIQAGSTEGLEKEEWYTPLSAAVQAKDLELVRILLESGADVNLRIRDSQTALSIAVKKGLSEMVHLLLEHGADPRQTALDGNKYSYPDQIEAFEHAMEHLVCLGNLSGDYYLDKRTALIARLASRQGITYKEAKARFA